MTIRTYTDSDLPEMVRVWNEIIEAGIYFEYMSVLHRTVSEISDWELKNCR